MPLDNPCMVKGWHIHTYPFAMTPSKSYKTSLRARDEACLPRREMADVRPHPKLGYYGSCDGVWHQ
jgi:hypothetical protein